MKPAFLTYRFIVPYPLLLLFVTTFMQGIYNYIRVPEISHVSKVYSVAAISHVQCFVLAH
jgi:hypothetical protein